MDVLGIFNDAESAANAVNSLVKAGFDEARITTLSSAPYPDGVIVKTDQRSWFRWFTLVCGIVGSGVGFLLAAGTAWLYPVKTGDKPIIAFYPTGIVTYELTMLFFLVGTMVGMFIEMRLPPAGKRLYDAAIGDGCVGICVSLPSEDWKGAAVKAMDEAGALRVTSEATL